MAIELILQIVELPQWVIAAVISIAIVAFGTFLTKFGKHSEVTISGPVEIRVLQEADKRIEGQLNKGIQDLKDMFEAAEGRTHTWKNQVLDRLGEMKLSQEKLGWRVGSVEEELKEIRDKRITALETELRGLTLTKERIATIEKEIKELNNKRKEGDR